MNASSKVVTFTPLGLVGEARPDETILDVARRAGAPLANSCGGVGVCARCRIRVLGGAENLSPPTSIEQRFSAGFGPDERMACQCVVRGECEVRASYW